MAEKTKQQKQTKQRHATSPKKGAGRAAASVSSHRPSRHRNRLTRYALWGGGVAMAAFLAWAFYYLFLSPSGIRWGTAVFPKEYAVRGIDVSHHQNKINWELLRKKGTFNNNPLAFVFVKATEGTDFIDPRFEYNYAKASEYGFIRGAYHFYNVNAPAEEQARFFISHVALRNGDLPPVLDVETRPVTISDAQLRLGVLKWLRIVEEYYGVKPILYTYKDYKHRYLNDTALNRYPLWIAHYNTKTPGHKGPWHFWQLSDRGSMPGIKGNVDFNVFNGTLDELQLLTVGANASGRLNGQ